MKKSINLGVISPRSSIADPYYIGRGSGVYGPSKVGSETVIEDNVCVGYPYEKDRLCSAIELWEKEGIDFERLSLGAIIGERCILGIGTIVSNCSELANSVECEPYSFIGIKTNIGARTRVIYRAQIYDNISIGEDCVIGGFVGDNSRLGNRVRMLGSLIHTHKVPIRNRPHWDDLSEPGPTIEDNVIIGFNSIVIGEVTIGEGAYVAAGAVVIRDVAPRARVAGNPAKIIGNVKE